MISNFCIYNTYTKSVQYGYLPWPTSWGRWSSTDDPRKIRKARSFLNTRHPAFPNIRIFLGDETVYRVRIQLELVQYCVWKRISKRSNEYSFKKWDGIMSEQNTLNLIHHLLLDSHGFFDGSIFGRSYLPRSNKHFPLSHRVRKFQVSCTTFFFHHYLNWKLEKI